MLEILMIKITKFMDVLSEFLEEKFEEKIKESITYLDDVFGDGKTNKDNGKALDNGGPDNNDPENSGPDNNEPENSGLDKIDPNKDSSEGDYIISR